MLLIEPSIEYNKKPGKPSTVKAVKDSAVPRDDLYKSGTIHTSQGEPANSKSRPTPKGKPKPGRPVNSGKLLRPGGPGGRPSKLASRPAAPRPVPQPMPGQPQSRPTPPQAPSQARPLPQPAVAQPKAVPQPLATINGAGHGRTASSSSINRAPPPPPPPTAPPSARKDLFRALYDFNDGTENKLALQKGVVVEVIRKENNGMNYCLLNVLYFGIRFLNPFANEPFRMVASKKPRRSWRRLDTICLPDRRSAHIDTSTHSPRPGRSCCAAAASVGSIHQRRERNSCPSFARKSKAKSPGSTETTRRWQETCTASCS